MPFVRVTILTRELFYLCVKILNELLQLIWTKLRSLGSLEYLVVVATSIEDQSLSVLAHLYSFINLHADLLHLSRLRTQRRQLLIYLHLTVTSIAQFVAQLFLQLCKETLLLLNLKKCLLLFKLEHFIIFCLARS